MCLKDADISNLLDEKRGSSPLFLNQNQPNNGERFRLLFVSKNPDSLAGAACIVNLIHCFNFPEISHANVPAPRSFSAMARFVHKRFV
jgi:hypothetical protein